MILKVKWLVPRISPGAEWSEEREQGGFQIRFVVNVQLEPEEKHYKKAFKHLQHPEIMQLSYEAK